jgi:hypothetical protein
MLRPLSPLLPDQIRKISILRLSPTRIFTKESLSIRSSRRVTKRLIYVISLAHTSATLRHPEKKEAI